MAGPQAAALLEAGRQLELSKIPLWFGETNKDAFTAHTWVDRLDQAAVLGNWDAQRTAIYMNMAFRDSAIKWRDGIKQMGVDIDNYQTLRTAFLRFYAPGATIRSCVANLDLKQGANETARDYGPRVAKIIQDIHRLAPPYAPPADNLLFGAAVSILPEVVALPAAGRQAAHTAIVQIGEKRITDLISIHIFIAGLKVYLRDKCVTRVFNSYYEAYQFACTLEHNMSDPRKTAHVTEVSKSADSTEGSDPSVDEIELEINKLQLKLKNRRNKLGGSSHKAKSSTSSGAAQRDYSAYKCRYCQALGHIQSNCRKRAAAGAPLVDARGTPMQQRVAQVGEEQPSSGALVQSQPQSQQHFAGYSQAGFNPFAESTVNTLFQQPQLQQQPHLNWY